LSKNKQTKNPKTQQILLRMWGKRELSSIVGGNVN
jgi:hypothetical protein